MKVGLVAESIVTLEVRDGILFYTTLDQSEVSTGIKWESITELIVEENFLVSLPPLPRGLEVLECDQNHLRSLPPLHEGMRGLSCSGNFIEVLPAFPSTLKSAWVSDNRLTSLPEIPAGMTAIHASDNTIEVLPRLDHTSIVVLVVGNNPIKTLPPLPGRLCELWVEGCMLEALPPIGNIQSIECRNNPFPYGIDISTIPEVCDVYVEDEVYERFEVRKKMRVALTDLVAAVEARTHRRLMEVVLAGVASLP